MGLKDSLTELKDSYMSPYFDKPDSGKEILEKIKNKELGKEWWEEETRKLKALKNVIPEKRQKQIGSVLSKAGQMFDTAWKGAETVENWTDPGDVIAAGTAHTINTFNKGVGLLSETASLIAHEGLRMHKPVANLTGNVASVYLTRKLMSGTNRVIRSPNTKQLLKNITPTSKFNPASGKVINTTATPVHGLGITAESSKTIAKKYPWLTGNKPKSYAFAYDNSQGGGLLKDAIKTPGLTKHNVTVSQVNLPKNLKNIGQGMWDPNEAKAIRELVLSKANERLNYRTNIIKEAVEKVQPGAEYTSLSRTELNKILKDQGVSKLVYTLGKERKALNRSIVDWTSTPDKDLHQLGVFQELKEGDFTQLEPQNIHNWLKVQEGRVSGSKGLDARHHAVLSSNKEILNPEVVPEPWRKEYLAQAEEKYGSFGSSSVISQDIGGHKAFDTASKEPGKPWNVKGRLGETLKKYTDLPLSKKGTVISPKVTRDVNDVPIIDSSTIEGKVQKILLDMRQKTSHGHWAKNNTGFTVDGRLANYSPKTALLVAEHIYDIEQVIAQQGVKITQQMNYWQKNIDQGKFGNPPDMSKALDAFQKRIDNLEIPDIKGMEQLYEQDLNTLLTKGEEALRQQQANRIN